MGKIKLPLRKPVPRRKLVRFLRRCGWVLKRNANGDHEVWVYTNGCQLVIPVRSGGAPLGQPFLRQINQAMLDGRIQSRGRQPASHGSTLDPP